MNNVRIGLIVICATAGVSAYLSLRDTETIDEPVSRTTGAPVTPFAASVPSTASRASARAPHEAQATASGRASEVRELAADSDTSGLLAPTTTLDELLDAFDADVGAEGEPIDREALGAELREDPALAEMLKHSRTR